MPNDRSLAGTYQSVVFFADRAQASSGPGAQFVTRQRLGLIVYVTIAGTATTGSTLSDMYLDGKTLKVVVNNQGNTLMRASGPGRVPRRHGQDSGDAPRSGQARHARERGEIDLALPKDLAPGYYVALALIEDSRGGSLAGQLPFQLRN